MNLKFGIFFFIAFISCYIYLFCQFRKMSSYLNKAISFVDETTKQRFALIQDLMKFIRDYNIQDSELVQMVSKLCYTNYNKCNKFEKFKITEQIERIITKISTLKATYPELDQDANFVNLMNKIKNVDQEIAETDQYKNAFNNMYNDIIAAFPPNIRQKVDFEENS